MRLIDADKFVLALMDASLSSVDEDTILDLVDSVNTVDAVPVVRCKDCKWFIENNNDEWWGCWLYHTIKVTPEDAPKPNDFCSYGERKDGDEQ